MQVNKKIWLIEIKLQSSRYKNEQPQKYSCMYLGVEILMFCNSKECTALKAIIHPYMNWWTHELSSFPYFDTQFTTQIDLHTTPIPLFTRAANCICNQPITALRGNHH